jgi:peptidoglycan-N-acetylglucosamine deacetylase
MSTGYTFKKTYLQKSKNKASRNAARILIAVAFIVGIFVVINRLPKKPNPVDTNTPPTNTTATNKNINQPTNTSNKNTNTNSATEPITEVTNTTTNTMPVFTGTPPEINKGDTTKRQVIFTFDAGSGTQSAQQILDTLKKYNLKGTFFMTGKWMEKNPDLVKQIAAAGHEIHNHTYSHPHLTQISDAEIINELSKTEEIFHNLTGGTLKPYFRPPYGERNTHVLEIAAQQGYQSIYWTVDALDWEESTGMTAAKVKEKILTHISPGTIYLMHVGDTITGSVLDDVFQQIQAKGYDIVPLSKGL